MPYDKFFTLDNRPGPASRDKGSGRSVASVKYLGKTSDTVYPGSDNYGGDYMSDVASEASEGNERAARRYTNKLAVEADKTLPKLSKRSTGKSSSKR